MERIGFFVLAALAIIAIGWYAARQSRVRGEKQVLKEQVQTWEDEGGNVPEVSAAGARTNPSRTDSSRRGA